MDIEQRNKIISAAGTLAILGLVVVACLLMGLKFPDPPIPEEGVEVNLGNSDMGLGDAENPQVDATPTPPTPPPSQGENISTQKAPSAAINTTPNPQPTKPETQQPEQPKMDPTKLFKKSNKDGGSQGVTQGQGDQGKEGGDKNSNRYDGQPGNGGPGWDLSGRRASSLPTPTYNSQKEGKVVVKIWVNQQGVVTQASAPERGSTITETKLVEQAKKAAMQAKFNADPNAADSQAGTITYVFRNK